MRLWLTLVVLYLAPLPLLGETCRYVDKHGHTIYSNVAVPDARKIRCFEAPEPSSPGSTQGGPSKPKLSSGPERDDNRRRLLEEQLASEQLALEDARNALAAQESVRYGNERNYARVLERLRPYQDAVAMHEKNVASLKQDLANLR
jgi:hypothetical protein